jgi:hypothetical protein
VSETGVRGVIGGVVLYVDGVHPASSIGTISPSDKKNIFIFKLVVFIMSYCKYIAKWL